MFHSSHPKHAKLKHQGCFASMGCDVGIAAAGLSPSNLQAKRHP